MTRFNPQRNHRRSIRLKGHDYAQVGAYFITICTYNRACIFGGIADGIMVLTAAGDAATRCWLAIPDHYPWVQLDAFVVMPNHVHGIIHIVDRLDVGAKNISPYVRPNARDIRPNAPDIRHNFPTAPIICTDLRYHRVSGLRRKR